MLKFFLGTIVGAAMAFGYVRWDLALPDVFELPETLKGNLVSTAAEGDLYNLDQPLAVRLRALEVFFKNRSKFAASVDRDFDHPFLKSLYRKRVIREARQLRGQLQATETALEQASLREMLERTHGTTDTERLKKRVLMKALGEREFLAKWVAKNVGPLTEDNLLPTLTRLSAMP